MARLSSIISSVLRDFLVAQHQANLYSLGLQQEYNSTGQAKEYPLPAVAVGDIELTLNYGVNNAQVTSSEQEINITALRNFIGEISLPLAKVVISGVLATLQSTDDTVEDITAHLQLIKSMRGKFATFMKNKIEQYLNSHITELIDANGHINKDTILEMVVDVGKTEFLQHNELDTLFNDTLREQALKGMRNSLDGILINLIGDSNFSEKKFYPSLDITIDSQELLKLPPESIHTIRFKVIPTEINQNIK